MGNGVFADPQTDPGPDAGAHWLHVSVMNMVRRPVSLGLGVRVSAAKSLLSMRQIIPTSGTAAVVVVNTNDA